MLFIVHAGEMKECQHITTDVFTFFPYHADFYADRWIERDAGNIGRGKFIGHAGIEKTGVFTGFYELQGRIDLAASHDDIWSVAIHFKTHFEKLVLDRVCVEKDQRLL